MADTERTRIVQRPSAGDVQRPDSDGTVVRPAAADQTVQRPEAAGVLR
jgi:hypothetical protein